ncbi:hypothetical protein KSF_030820 [Reticulibacter mediterranei]|uniref:Uncharacterized protein n=1 Tax=Reticulibacter mediterranei TaxID=2778369 RepID=A0A8J3IKC3_9CHLR|nr:hypothetical protein [Reticulibacter mediterranei]GHO93034.1 hypothetical protein KSF_030820 [Reticulibacter mediterranei]
MLEWYKRKLLQRLGSAWPYSKLRPIDVEEIDTRTWHVVYRHAETGETSSSLLLKRDLRKQERLHRLPVFGVEAGQKPSLDPIPAAADDEDEEPAPSPVVLSFSPDTAYYTIRPTDRDYQPVRVELDVTLQEELNALKQKAQELDELVPTRWVFGTGKKEEQTLHMRDKGGSQFKWILENDKITLSVGRGKKTGIIGRVRLSSEYLQMDCGGDLGRALSAVHVFLSTFYGEHILLDLSALDLAADVLYLDLPSLNLKECFLSRAVLDTERPAEIDAGLLDGPSSIQRRWKKIAGLSFGMHTSPVSAVIYNKTHEIKYHSPEKRWFYDKWRLRAEQLGIEFSPEMIVWRVEVRFTRTPFREFPGVSGAYEMLEHIGDLWTYAVGHPGGGADGLPDGWLRYVIPSDDTNRSRWPVHPAWEVIQRACVEQPLPESEYEQEQREREELLRLADEELEARPFSPPVLPPVEHLHSAKKKRVRPVAPAASAEPLPVEELAAFVRKRKREANMERAIAQMAGWLPTIEAFRRGYETDLSEEEKEVTSDVSATLHFVAGEVDHYMNDRRIEFSEVVEKKRVLYRMKAAANA